MSLETTFLRLRIIILCVISAWNLSQAVFDSSRGRIKDESAYFFRLFLLAETMTRSMKLRNNADRFRRKKEETEERESIKGGIELKGQRESFRRWQETFSAWKRDRETSRRPWKGAIARSAVLREAPSLHYKCERAGENHLSTKWEAKKPTTDLLCECVLRVYVYSCTGQALDDSGARVLYIVGSQVVAILTRKQQERCSVVAGEDTDRNQNNFDRNLCSLSPSDVPSLRSRHSCPGSWPRQYRSFRGEI